MCACQVFRECMYAIDWYLRLVVLRHCLVSAVCQRKYVGWVLGKGSIAITGCNLMRIQRQWLKWVHSNEDVSQVSLVVCQTRALHIAHPTSVTYVDTLSLIAGPQSFI